MAESSLIGKDSLVRNPDANQIPLINNTGMFIWKY